MSIYYIFCSPVKIWNLKKADSISIIEKNESKHELINYAYSLCKGRKASLFIFDIAGNLSDKVIFSKVSLTI